MNLHKVYACVIAVVLVLAAVAGVVWTQHVRDDAKRDATIDAQKADIAKLEQDQAAIQKQAEAQIAALQQQKQQVITVPAQAPTIIREQIPFSTPVVQTAPIEKSTPPDAPVAQLTKQNEVDLAQYAISCKQCGLQRDQLAGELKDEQQINARQKVELDAAMKAAKGGSIWQRTKRAAEWVAISGAVGYVIGRAQK